MSSPSPGLIRVTGDFINGSSATSESILAIVYSTDHHNGVYYMISSLSARGETLVTNISNFLLRLVHTINVSVFVLKEVG